MTELDAAIARIVGACPDELRSAVQLASPRLNEEGAIVSRGVTKNGRTWKVDTHVRGYKITQKGFPSKEAAQTWLAQIRSSTQMLDDWLKGRRFGTMLTVERVLRDWYDAKGKKVASARRYKQLMTHVIRILGKGPAAKVGQQQVDVYREQRLGEGAAPKGVHNELSALRTALRWAYENERLRKVPAFKLSKKGCNPRTRIAEPTEFRLVLDPLELSLRRLIWAYYTRGMRRNEALEMRWSWINKHSQEATIPAELTKARKAKVVWLGGELWEMLQAEPVHPVYVFSRWRLGTNGKATKEPTRWYPSPLRKLWLAACERASVEGLTIHDLRRSFATTGMSLGHPKAVIEAVGGWASQSSSALDVHYLHASKADQRRLVMDMEAALLGRPAQVAKQPAPNPEITPELLAKAIELVQNQGPDTSVCTSRQSRHFDIAESDCN